MTRRLVRVAAVASVSLIAACGTTNPLLRNADSAAGSVVSDGSGVVPADGTDAGIPGTVTRSTTVPGSTASGPVDSGGDSPGGTGTTSAGSPATGAAVSGTSGGAAQPGGTRTGTSATAAGAPTGGTDKPGTTTGRGGGTKATATGAPTATASAIPSTGKGWDKQYAYVAVITARDAGGAAAALGLNISPGDQLGDANAIVAAINKRGGLFGRQVKLVDHDVSTANVETDPVGTGEAACTALTQDTSVLAVVNIDAGLDTDSMRACFANAKTPLISMGTVPFDDQTSAALAPYFYNALSASYTRLASVEVTSLKQQGFFSGWSAQLGNASANSKVVVGIIGSSDPSGDRAVKALQAQVGGLGFQTATFESANEANDGQAAVLRMNGAGVTHLLSADAFLFYFLTAANSQHYYPRLGVSTYNGLQSLIGSDPPQQLNGALGVGWNPSLDVNSAQDPGNVGPGEAQCLADLAAGGQMYSNHQFAKAVGLALCDGINLPVLGAKAGGGMDPASIRRGVLSYGLNFPVGGSFGSGLTSTSFGLPGAGRNLQYLNSCSCFSYVGGTYAFQ